MALRRALAKRLSAKHTEPSPVLSPPWQRRTLVPPNAAKTNFHTSPEPIFPHTGFIRRFLQRRGINQSPSGIPEFLTFPVGDGLRKKLNIPGDRIRLEGLITPPMPSPAPEDPLVGISVRDARKILRSSQLEKLRTTLRQIPTNTIAYDQFVGICSNVCCNAEQGAEFAKMLDEAGNVIILGNVVFLQPEQVAKSMEKLISQSIASPTDPRRRELEQMEELKAQIDRKAKALVRGELYCGLGYLIVQTVGFMRLTFWELSWDVMEPICFFVTSLHFALAYGFFLRTSKEPTFEGFFQRRFRVKQKKLMETHSFDAHKYNELCNAFYPGYNGDNSASLARFQTSAGQAHAGSTVFG